MPLVLFVFCGAVCVAGCTSVLSVVPVVVPAGVVVACRVVVVVVVLVVFSFVWAVAADMESASRLQAMIILFMVFCLWSGDT